MESDEVKEDMCPASISELFAKQAEVYVADRIESGIEASETFVPSLPFGNMYLLIHESGSILCKVRLNRSMVPLISVNNVPGFDSGTGLLSREFPSANGCMGSILYQLLPILFSAQIANHCTSLC